MYNLLTVDDESIERRAVSLLLDKLDIPVNVLEAGNGRQALELLREQPVRIVITDIRMPVMDGLELSGMIAKEFPDIKIIIYSAFGEFDYARQAIRAGVSNYLLKPIQAAELKSVMDAVLADCERDDSQKANFGRLERISGELEDFKRQQMLGALLKPPNGEGLFEAASEWLHGQGTAFPLHLLLVKGRGSGLRKIWNEISGFPCDCLELTDNECLFFVYPGKKLPDTQMAALGERLRKKIWKIYSQHSFVVAAQAVHTPEEIAASYKMLDDAADYSFFMREGGAFLVRDGYFIHNNTAPLDESLLNCIYEDAAYRDIDKLKKDFHVFVKSIQNASGLSHLYVKSIFSSLFGKLCGSAGLLPEQEGREILKEIARSPHIDELLAYVETQLANIGQRAAQAQDDGRSATTGVQLALKIIHQNYTDPLLSLENLAGRVYWSPGYLSVVFKRETGLSVSKYICRYRLERAERLLLTTNVRVADIGMSVGFSSDSYFVSVFGAHYGQSPSKYRKNKGKAG
jgi:two-component system response regulator YesN